MQKRNIFILIIIISMILVLSVISLLILKIDPFGKQSSIKENSENNNLENNNIPNENNQIEEKEETPIEEQFIHNTTPKEDKETENQNENISDEKENETINPDEVIPKNETINESNNTTPTCINESQTITCSNLECGTKINNCDNEIICGSCNTEDLCSNNICLPICGNNICQEGENENNCIEDCNPYTLASGDHKFTTNSDNLERDYLVYAPSAYQKESSSPVVIMIHGGGGSGEQLRKTQNMDEIANNEGFLVVYPDGTGRFNNHYSWNGGSCCGYAKNNNIDDISFINKMIEELKINFNINSSKIYLAGISNGGVFANRVACELPNKIAAIAAIAAPVGTNEEMADCSPSRPIPIMIFHGKQDPCAPINGDEDCGGCFSSLSGFGSSLGKCLGAEEVKQNWMTRNNCEENSEITLQNNDVTCTSYNKCNQDSEILFCTSESGGHNWPSQLPNTFNSEVVGEPTYSISNHEIWGFFNKHSLDIEDQNLGIQNQRTTSEIPKQEKRFNLRRFLKRITGFFIKN